MSRVLRGEIVATALGLSVLLACGSEKPGARGAQPTSDCAQETPVPPKAVASRGITWKDATAQMDDADPQIHYAVPPYSGKVCGVRLRFTLTTSDGGPAYFQLFWRKGDAPFADRQQHVVVESSSRKCWPCPSPPAQTVTVPVQDELDTLRVDPGAKPGTFELFEIVLLTKRQP